MPRIKIVRAAQPADVPADAVADALAALPAATPAHDAPPAAPANLPRVPITQVRVIARAPDGTRTPSLDRRIPLREPVWSSPAESSWAPFDAWWLFSPAASAPPPPFSSSEPSSGSSFTKRKEREPLDEAPSGKKRRVSSSTSADQLPTPVWSRLPSRSPSPPPSRSSSRPPSPPPSRSSSPALPRGDRPPTKLKLTWKNRPEWLKIVESVGQEDGTERVLPSIEQDESDVYIKQEPE